MFFKEQYYTYLVQIAPVAPTAEFSAHPTDNSTTSGILLLVTLLGNHHLSPVPARRFLMVCSPSWIGDLLSTGSELVEGSGLELVPRLHTRTHTHTRVGAFCVVLYNVIWNCKTSSVPRADDSQKLVMWPETDVDSQLPLTSFDVTHAGLAAVKAEPTSHPDVRERERERERDCLQPLIK